MTVVSTAVLCTRPAGGGRIGEDGEAKAAGRHRVAARRSWRWAGGSAGKRIRLVLTNCARSSGQRGWGVWVRALDGRRRKSNHLSPRIHRDDRIVRLPHSASRWPIRLLFRSDCICHLDYSPLHASRRAHLEPIASALPLATVHVSRPRLRWASARERSGVMR